ncbi:hypothetical protein, partial [Salmonella enterica]|uniref:hypothetical protein n=1 Tax=Salmonella enterica TaxID=28901 RepID=UPI003D279D2C
KSLFFLFSHSYFDLQTKVHPKDFLISQYFGYLCQSSLNHFAARIEGKYPGLTKIQELSWGVHIASCVVASMSSDLHLIHDVNNWIDVAQMAAHEY